MSTPVLYIIEISPWSEKARWALDFHKLTYEPVEYISLFMAPTVKLKTLFKRKLTKKLTIPLLIDGSEVYTDSFDIALHADKKVGSELLFPKADYDKIKRLNALSDRLLNIFRAQVFHRTKTNHQAKLERLIFVPEKQREFLTKTVNPMIRFLEKKYPVSESESASSLLEKIRAELGDRPYVLDEFSFADITLAMPLQFVSPVDNQYIDLGYHVKKTMEDIELAKEFKDLIDWRDQLYEKHRK
jgi:glutathione S-transferase